MSRRRFIAGAVLAVTSLGATASAQEYKAQHAGKVWRIGFLGVGTTMSFQRNIEAMRLGLREHGCVEGRNITMEFRWAEGRYDRLPALAAELVQLKLDVIITHGRPGTLALRQATPTNPIVMAAIGDPVEAGVVASLARPGGNITGSAFLSEEVTAKRLDLLKAALPALTRVGFLANLDNVGTPSALRTFERMAQALNVRVQSLEVRRLDDLDATISSAKTQIDALVVPDEQLFSSVTTSRRIADLAIRNRLPSIGFTGYAAILDFEKRFPSAIEAAMSGH
jgi:putative ABC transport system substrate-binding protein